MALEVVQLSDIPGRVYNIPPRVTIATSGICIFNKMAAKEYLLEEGKNLKLYYDKVEKHLGFEITNHGDENTLIIRKNVVINLNKFFFLYKLNIEEFAGSYDIIPHGALFIIDLNNGRRLQREKVKE